MKPFYHVHSSSRYDRPLESLKKAAVRYFSISDLVTFTEVSFEKRENTLRTVAGNSWGVVTGDHGNHDDCAVCFKKSEWELEYKESYRITVNTFFRRTGRDTTDKYAINAILRHRDTGRRLVVVVTHLPSSVEGELRSDKKTLRTVAWHQAFFRSKARGNKLKRNHKADAVLYVSDFNVNFKQDWVRRLIKGLAPAYTLAWRRPFPTGGTHHSRLIDATLYRGDLKLYEESHLLADDASSDHRPYVDGFNWA